MPKKIFLQGILWVGAGILSLVDQKAHDRLAPYKSFSAFFWQKMTC